MQLCIRQLFLMIGGESGADIVPCHAAGDEGQGDLFGKASKQEFHCDKEDIAVMAGMHSARGIDFSTLPPHAHRLFELSANAFSAITHAWMSELPVTAEIVRFGRNILAASTRHAADRIATDRVNPDVQTVLEAAYKTRHEIHRLMGLLRFSPDEDGVYIAPCEPDHFILPALGPHFMERFGETPWAIIDVKRRLCLRRDPGKPLNFFTLDDSNAGTETPQTDEWEDLWRRYHKTINNESRNNPALQQQFMPKRYWKYLTEVAANR